MLLRSDRPLSDNGASPCQGVKHNKNVQPNRRDSATPGVFRTYAWIATDAALLAMTREGWRHTVQGHRLMALDCALAAVAGCDGGRGLVGAHRGERSRLRGQAARAA